MEDDRQTRPVMTKPVTVYGIKNCDTMKKARAWLDGHGIAYAFHDYKSVGVTPDLLEAWARKVGWEVLLNRAGTTYRKLADKDKDGMTQKRAIALMAAQPTLIKRPVIASGSKLIVGYRPDVYAAAFGK